MNIKDLNKNFIEVASKFGYLNKKPSSIILRNDKPPFFTFSPVQNVMHKFGKDEKAEYLLQECFRQIPFDEVKNNPLATSTQLIYSIFNYSHVPIKQPFLFLEEMLVNTFGLDKEKIHIAYDKSNEHISNTIEELNFNGIATCKDELICNMPIEYESIYLKVNYQYNDGLVPLCNLVFVGQENDTTMVDSVIYPERLLFVLNKNEHIYDECIYTETINIIKSVLPSQEIEFCYALASHIRMITYLYSLKVIPSAKKEGYILRNMLRQLFTNFIVKDIDISQSQLNEILSSIINSQYLDYPKNINTEIISRDIKEQFDSYKKVLNKSKKQLFDYLDSNKELTDKDCTYFYETLGINKNLLRKYLIEKLYDLKEVEKLIPTLDKSIYPFNFDKSLNYIKQGG